jgi:hypothetical protein
MECSAVEICYLDFKSFSFSDAHIILQSQANPVIGSIYITFWQAWFSSLEVILYRDFENVMESKLFLVVLMVQK